jgi:hypothetical protein
LVYSSLTFVIPKGYVDKKSINNEQNKTLDKRNPPPPTVSCAISGEEGPTIYIQTKERKKTKNKRKKKNKKQKTKTTCATCE